MSLLVVGAKENSLGEAVRNVSNNLNVDAVYTAGLSGEEYHLDVINSSECLTILRGLEVKDVVCTVGINGESSSMSPDWLQSLYLHMNTNFLGVATLLHAWIRYQQDLLTIKPYEDDSYEDERVRQFVVVSSNSAHIARSKSAGYCASKAALSMLIRCAAREVANFGYPEKLMHIYGYEPGWIDGTPMSEEVLTRLSTETQPHRIPGGNTTSRYSLAETILINMRTESPALNGTLLRIDGGEQ